VPYTTLEFTAGSPKNLFAIMSIVHQKHFLQDYGSKQHFLQIYASNPTAQWGTTLLRGGKMW